MTTLLLLVVVGYVIGGIPVGVLVARAHGIDIFKVGSGNIGATNVKRALGTKWAIFVFAMDVVKGVVPALAARFLIKGPVGPLDAEVCWLVAGLGAVMGHCLSPFLKFKGGKGIATSLGAVVTAAPLVALSAFVVFVLVFTPTAYVSLASLIAAPSTLVFGSLYPGESPQMLPVYFAMTLFIVFRHRGNIRRLMNGTESKTHLFKGKGKKD